MSSSKIRITADGHYALRLNARMNRLDIVKLLVQAGSDIQACRNDCFMSAVQHGNISMMQYCISVGADAKATRRDAMLYAAQLGHDHVVKYLAQNGFQAADKHSMAIRLAAKAGHWHCVRQLHALGADLNIAHNAVFRYACRLGDIQMATYAVRHGCLTTLGLRYGLESAAKAEHWLLVRWLIWEFADDIRCDLRLVQHLWQAVLQHDQVSIAQLLRQHTLECDPDTMTQYIVEFDSQNAMLALMSDQQIARLWPLAIKSNAIRIARYIRQCYESPPFDAIDSAYRSDLDPVFRHGWFAMLVIIWPMIGHESLLSAHHIYLMIWRGRLELLLWCQRMCPDFFKSRLLACESCFYFAAKYGHRDVVMFLHQIKPIFPYVSGSNYFVRWAIGYHDIRLLQKYQSWSFSFILENFVDAIMQGNVDVVRWLYKSTNLKIDTKMPYYITIACEFGHAELVAYMLDCGFCCESDCLQRAIDNKCYNVAWQIMHHDLIQKVPKNIANSYSHSDPLADAHSDPLADAHSDPLADSHPIYIQRLAQMYQILLSVPALIRHSAHVYYQNHSHLRYPLQIPSTIRDVLALWHKFYRFQQCAQELSN